MKNRVQKYKNSIIILLLCLVFISMIFFTVDRNKVSLVEDAVIIPVNGIQRVVYKVTNGITSSVKSLINYKQLKAENEELKDEINSLQDDMSKLNMIKKDYEDLKEILDYKDTREDFEYIACEIIGKSGNGYFQGFIVNRGTDDGIEKRMVAITPKGLVGQVSAVGKNWAKIQTLANENIAVAGFVSETSETNGIVRGYRDYDNRILAKIEIPTLDSEIKEGDTILTSGVGEIYPRGILIGTVKEVYDNKSKVIKYGIIEPSVEINKIDKLSIVKPKNIREINE